MLFEGRSERYGVSSLASDCSFDFFVLWLGYGWPWRRNRQASGTRDGGQTAIRKMPVRPTAISTGVPVPVDTDDDDDERYPLARSLLPSLVATS